MVFRRVAGCVLLLVCSVLGLAGQAAAETGSASGPPPVADATLNSPRMIDTGPGHAGLVLPPTAGAPSQAAPLSSAVRNAPSSGSGPGLQGTTTPQSRALGQGPGEPERTSSNNPLRFNGGYVQHHPHQYLIFWGKSWTEKPGVREKVVQLYNSLNGSGYAGDLTQYFDYGGNYSGDNSVAGSYIDERADPTNITEASIKGEIQYVIEHQGWPRGNYENQYVVLASPKSTIAGGEPDYCGYHNWWGEGWSVPLTFLPWPEPSPDGCNYGGAWEPWEILQVAGSHEWAETVTDPIPYAPYAGWDNTHWVECVGECGEIFKDVYGDCGQYFCVAEEEVADVCPTAATDEGIWHFRIFDDYLAASESHVECVLHDASPGRFSVQLYETMIETATHSAEMRGGVNPVGWDANYQFELSHGSETQTVPASPGEIYGAYKFAPVAESAHTGRLHGSTTYHVRLSSASELTTPNAWNTYGLTGSFPFVAEGSFTTPSWLPTITGVTVTERTTTSVAIRAMVNPEGGDTHVHVEYEGTGLGGSGATAEVDVGSGAVAVPVTITVTGLKPESRHGFRVVAGNEEGTVNSSTKVAYTLANPPTFERSFGALGSGSGQFNDPLGVATDSAGDLWVADTKNNRLEELNPKGEVLRLVGSAGTGNGQFSSPQGVAVGPNGHVFVADTGNHRVEEFSAEGAFLQKMGSGEACGTAMSYPTGIAVGPTGLVWVTDPSREKVYEFAESLNGGGCHWRGEFAGKCGGCTYSSPGGLAVDPAGDLWILDAGTDRIEEWGPAAEFLTQFRNPGSGQGQFNEPDAIAALPTGNLMIVDRGNSRVQEIAPNGEFLAAFGSAGSGSGQLSRPGGVALGKGGTILVADSGDNRIERWGQVHAPEATTEPARSVAQSTATLAGSVDPTGLATNYVFEYGTGGGYGSKVPASGAAVGNGVEVLPESAALTGLKPGTTYYFRIVAENAEGTAYGAGRSFTTAGAAPTVTTEAAAGLTETGATLRGVVNPNGVATTYFFEYGRGGGYGSKVPVPAASIGSGNEVVSVANAITGLLPNTKYYFRLVAENSVGKTLGSGLSFTTP